MVGLQSNLQNAYFLSKFEFGLDSLMFLEEYDVVSTVGSILFKCVGLKNCFVDVYKEVHSHTRCFEFIHCTATTSFHSGDRLHRPWSKEEVPKAHNKEDQSNQMGLCEYSCQSRYHS